MDGGLIALGAGLGAGLVTIGAALGIGKITAAAAEATGGGGAQGSRTTPYCQPSLRACFSIVART